MSEQWLFKEKMATDQVYVLMKWSAQEPQGTVFKSTFWIMVMKIKYRLKRKPKENEIHKHFVNFNSLLVPSIPWEMWMKF